MAAVPAENYPGDSSCFDYQFSVLGWRMSRQGIRSLVIVLAIGIVFWIGLVIEILYVTGVLNG